MTPLDGRMGFRSFGAIRRRAYRRALKKLTIRLHTIKMQAQALLTDTRAVTTAAMHHHKYTHLAHTTGFAQWTDLNWPQR